MDSALLGFAAIVILHVYTGWISGVSICTVRTWMGKGPGGRDGWASGRMGRFMNMHTYLTYGTLLTLITTGAA